MIFDWFRRSRGAGLGLLVVIPLVGLIGVTRFDGLYGQDPYAYYAYAIGPVRESILHFQPLPPFFWPPGYPLLIALASLVLGKTPFAGQFVSLSAGAVTAALTFCLAEEIRLSLNTNAEAIDQRWSWLAGLIMALLPQLWQSSFVVMADTTGLAAATLGAWAVARYGRTQRLAWLLLSAGALAYAILARWAYALVAVPCAFYAFLVLGQGWRQTRSPLRPFTHALCAALISAAILSPVWVSFFLRGTSPSAQSSFIGDLEVYSWSPLNALRREFVTADGVLSYQLPNGLYYGTLPGHLYYFTPLLVLFILPGLWYMWQRHNALTLALLVGWPGMVYAFHAGAPWQNFRFMLAAMPPLAILLALGVGAASGRLRGYWRVGLWLLVASGLGAMVFGGARVARQFVVRKNADLALVRAVESQVPPGARLLTFSVTLTFQHYSRLETFELSELRPAALSTLLADGRPTYLLLDVNNIETQWRVKPLAESYHWLRDQIGFISQTSLGNLTLFTLRQP
jgi:4-amino-4-deoxy-L-arabinose transferase-like glycosyltransferase